MGREMSGLALIGVGVFGTGCAIFIQTSRISPRVAAKIRYNLLWYRYGIDTRYSNLKTKLKNKVMICTKQQQYIFYVDENHKNKY
ncbi:hypothetical protein HanPI659440_Chr02g0035901 [Helianthus annuus]|nr:hypothetical protein HanPI659440_Chr02g0035901 [Helianthus annuus]